MKPDKLAEKTKKDLLEIARQLSIPGRSTMSKGELIKAITADKPATPKRTSRSGSGPAKAAAKKKASKAPPEKPVPPPPPGRPGVAARHEAPRAAEDAQPPFDKQRPPFPSRASREEGPRTRRPIPPVDPGMKPVSYTHLTLPTN